MQEVFEGTTAVITVNVIDSGAHVAANIDTATTRLSTHASAVPTVTNPSTGVYKIKFSGLSPALSVSDNDDGVSCAVNGDIGGTAWSEYHVPIKVAATMRGTDSANTVAPDNASITSILADTNELQQNQGDWATATGFSTHSAADVVTALQAVANDFKADISALASQASVDTIDSIVDAIKAKTDQLAFTVAGQVDANALTGGGGDSAADIYTYFTDGTREDAFKADVSGLSTFDPSVDQVTTDAASRTASQATGFSTHAASDVVTAMQAVAGDFKASGFSTHAASDVVTAMQVVADDFKADVSSISVPTAAEVADAVWDEPVSGHVNTGSAGKRMEDMERSLIAYKGTISSAAGSNVTLGSSVPADDYFNGMTLVITEGTGYGQARYITDSFASGNIVQINEPWTTAPTSSSKYMVLPSYIESGSSSAPTAAEIYNHFTSGSNEDAFKADVSALATQAFLTTVNTGVISNGSNISDLALDVSTVDANVSAILADTNELQVNQNNWLTADVSSLAQSSELPANFSTLLIGTGADAGKVTTANPAAGSGSSHTAQDVANLILANPANLLVTNATGQVETSNASGSGGATAAEVYAEFTSGSNADAFKADVSALATAASITALNDPSSADIADAVWDELQADHVVTGSFGAYLDSAISGVSGGGGGGSTAAEIYTYFTTGVNADAFKADTSSLATSASISALNDISASDVYTYFTGLTRADAFKADVASLSTDISTVDSVVDAIKVKTDQLTFTVANQLDSNVLTGAGDDAATIYSYFIDGSREDVFKADTTGLATSADVSALNNITSADVYTYFTTAAREDVFKADISGLNDISAADVYSYFTQGTNEDAFKADVSGVASAAALSTLQSSVTNLNDISAADVYTHFTAGTNEDAFKADVSNLATSADVSGVPSEADIYNYFANSTRPDIFKADVTGLSTFDPALDAVANVTTVATVAGDVNTNAASRNASKADVSALATASSISALNDVSSAEVYAYFTDLTREDAFKADLSGLNDVSASDVVTAMQVAADDFKADVSSLATASALTTVDGEVGSILSLLQQVDVNIDALPAPATEAEIYSYFTAASREDAFKANVSGLASDSDVAAIKAKTDNLNFTIGGQVDANALTTAADTASDVLTVMLANAGSFKADVSGMSTFDPATDTVANVTNVASVSGAVTTDSASRLASQANVSGLATSSEIAGLNDPSAAEIYSHFTQLGREDVFKSDVSALASQSSVDSLNDLSGSEVAGAVWNALSASYSLSGSFGEFLDGNVSNAGGTGNGLYRVDVLVQDSALAAVPNARVSVDGTTYELTTNSSGIATFMLDSGVYTLRCSPPEGYDVPSDNVLTITTSDVNSSFTLSDTATPPSSSDVPWIG